MMGAAEMQCAAILGRDGQEICVKSTRGHGAGFDPCVRAVRQRMHEDRQKFGGGETLEQRRANMGWPNLDLSGGAVRTEDIVLHCPHRDVFAKLYRPAGDGAKKCLLFFHGGGFFGGSLRCVENPCKYIAQCADAVVVSVDYALAPEHPYPQGIEDCYGAVCYVHDAAATLGIDPGRLGVAGDSAGGNLAAVCALRDRDSSSHHIRFQGLLYPALNIGALSCPYYTWDIGEYALDGTMVLEREATLELGEDPQLLVNLYLQGDVALAKSQDVSPIFASSLAGLPPAVIANAEYDYLRLEGEAYGRRLAAAGVPVSMFRYAGTDHAFMDKLGEFPQAADALEEIARAFVRACDGG